MVKKVRYFSTVCMRENSFAYGHVTSFQRSDWMEGVSVQGGTCWKTKDVSRLQYAGAGSPRTSQKLWWEKYMGELHIGLAQVT